MTLSDSTRQADFSEALSRLVKKHINAGADPAAIADALALQAEVASSKAPGPDIDGSPSRDISVREQQDTLHRGDL